MRRVTINRVRAGVRRGSLTKSSWAYDGILVVPPAADRFLVIHNTGDDEHLTTSVVRRVLSIHDSRVVYVETDNGLLGSNVLEATELFELLRGLA
jgi:hypothetical protein